MDVNRGGWLLTTNKERIDGLWDEKGGGVSEKEIERFLMRKEKDGY